MFFKIHKTYRYVFAVCDSDLIGRTFEEGNFQLEVKENFFKGDILKGTSEISEKDLINLMQKFSAEDATFNIVGEKSVKAGLKAGIISKEGIKKIQGVPFALVLV